MKFGKINIKVDYEKAGIRTKEEFSPYLNAYLLDNQAVKEKRKAVIICPGGGYEFTSEREGEPIAMQFLKEGIQAFTLWYSVKPAIFPMALLELAEAVRIVRENAEKWNIDKNQIAVMGFSAGGHLAGSLGCLYEASFISRCLNTQTEMVKPNANILCYPVITSGEYAHRGSFDALLRNKSEDYFELCSLEKQVTKSNPPTFIWHTQEDSLVPVENTLLYMAALQKHHVPMEAHLFQRGPHGLSLATRETACDDFSEMIHPEVSVWVDLAIRWFKNL